MTHEPPTVRAKMELPFYTEGSDSPSLFSASDHNREVALMRALANIQIEFGAANEVLYSDLNVKIILKR